MRRAILFVATVWWTCFMIGIGTARAKPGPDPLLGSIRVGEQIGAVQAKCPGMALVDDSAAATLGTEYATSDRACTAALAQVLGVPPENAEARLMFAGGRLVLVSVAASFEVVPRGDQPFVATSAAVRAFAAHLGPSTRALPCETRCGEPSEVDARVSRLVAGYALALQASAGLLVFDFSRGKTLASVALMAPSAQTRGSKRWKLMASVYVE